MTYDAIVSLQARIPAQVGRDDLVMFEDALGRPTPFHLGFIDCWEVCHVSLQYSAWQADLRGFRIRSRDTLYKLSRTS